MYLYVLKLELYVRYWNSDIDSTIVWQYLYFTVNLSTYYFNISMLNILYWKLSINIAKYQYIRINIDMYRDRDISIIIDIHMIIE